MGFIQSNHSIIMYNNTMISFNMLEAARQEGITRFFYASSACVYPEGKQLETTVEGGGLKEADAWPAMVRGVAGKQQITRMRIVCVACLNAAPGLSESC